MIKSIEVENFFGTRTSQKVCLNAGINLLVGINGSGKSNFIKAFTLLNNAIRKKNGFQETFNLWGGFNSVANFSQEASKQIRMVFEFDKTYLNSVIEDKKGFAFPNNPFYEIVIHSLGNDSSYFISEKLYNEGVGGKRPFVYLDMQNGKGFISERKDGKSRLVWKETDTIQIEYKEVGGVFDDKELVLSQVGTDTLRFFPLFLIRKAIEDLDVYTYFDVTLNSRARQWNKDLGEDRLHGDASNLSLVFQRLNAKYPLAFGKIQEAVTKVNPYFKNITFDYIGGNFRIILTEKQLIQNIPLESISDGTLRYLILLAIIYNPSAGKLICFDEPELGLHPDMISILAETLREGVKLGKQFIIATHSPMLLNCFELDDVWIFEKDEANQTLITSKSEEDFENWFEEFLPGKLWLSGLLGGRRWG
ncbi:AAA family ATPase [Runella limosa]|uniref:AAA family ATPase n=1 Tax=Runella limosa TaxID=370978 RepID=UPI00048FE28B|nr:AAA family ATPase [Runella limosa]